MKRRNISAKRWFKPAALLSVLLCCALLLASCSLLPSEEGASTPEPYDYTTHMTLDTGDLARGHCSVELVSDTDDRIVSAEMVGARDSETVTEFRSLIGLSLRAAMKVVLNRLVQNGTLTAVDNTLLLSVDSVEAKRILRLANDEIDEAAEAAGFPFALITQRFTLTDELTLSAQVCGCSAGRYIFCERLSEVTAQTVRELLTLPLPLLNLYLHSDTVSSALISHTDTNAVILLSGEPSRDLYYSEDDAFELMLDELGLSYDDLSFASASARFRDLKLFYEFEFATEESRRLVWVDADAGTILDTITVTENLDHDIARIGGYIPSAQALHLTARNDRGYVIADYRLSSDGAVLILLLDGKITTRVSYSGTLFTDTIAPMVSDYESLSGDAEASGEEGYELRPALSPYSAYSLYPTVLIFSYYSGESLMHEAYLPNGRLLATLTHPSVSLSYQRTPREACFFDGASEEKTALIYADKTQNVESISAYSAFLYGFRAYYTDMTRLDIAGEWTRLEERGFTSPEQFFEFTAFPNAD